MLPYCLLLLFRAYIPLLWVDVPGPLNITRYNIFLYIASFSWSFEKS